MKAPKSERGYALCYQRTFRKRPKCKNVIVSFIIPETLQPDSVQILRSNLEQLLKM